MANMVMNCEAVCYLPCAYMGGSSMRYGIIYGIYQTEFLQEKLNLALNFKNLCNFQKLNEIKPVKLSISTNS
jgi:hypothetical protein